MGVKQVDIPGGYVRGELYLRANPLGIGAELSSNRDDLTDPGSCELDFAAGSIDMRATGLAAEYSGNLSIGIVQLMTLFENVQQYEDEHVVETKTGTFLDCSGNRPWYDHTAGIRCENNPFTLRRRFRDLSATDDPGTNDLAIETDEGVLVDLWQRSSFLVALVAIKDTTPYIVDFKGWRYRFHATVTLDDNTFEYTAAADKEYSRIEVFTPASVTLPDLNHAPIANLAHTARATHADAFTLAGTW